MVAARVYLLSPMHSLSPVPSVEAPKHTEGTWTSGIFVDMQVDTAFVGRLGVLQLAALGPNGALFNVRIRFRSA